MYRLGVAYEFGELGVEVDEPKALRFYTDAAAFGGTYAKEVVGMWLHRFYSPMCLCGGCVPYTRDVRLVAG